MDKQTAIRTGVAGAVAAAGLTVGDLAMASAAIPETSTRQTAPEKGDRPGDHGGPGRGFGDTTALAKALGVSEDKLTAALKTIREDQPGPEDRADGERPDPSVKQAERAASLAKELDISDAKVTKALETPRADAKTDRRAELSTRLDQAVEDGDLNTADKTSVLKAFDADAGCRAPPGSGHRLLAGRSSRASGKQEAPCASPASRPTSLWATSSRPRASTATTWVSAPRSSTSAGWRA